MKKIIVVILCFVSVSAWAQGRYFSSLEIVGGAGFGNGPKVVATPQYVGQYVFGGFRIGAGVGIRYAMPLYEEWTKDDVTSHEYNQELGIPVFLRLGFGGSKIYANVDAGYSFGLMAKYGKAMDGFILGDKVYDGPFLDPHIGWKITPKSAFAIGMLVQQCSIGNRVTTISGDNVLAEFHRGKEFAPALTLRYAFSF